MNILILGGAYSEDKKYTFLRNSKRGYSYSAQTFQEALFDGILANNSNFYCLSTPYLSTFPFGYRCPIVKSGAFIYKGSKCGHTFGSLNLPFLRDVSLRRYMKYVKRWVASTSGKRVVLMYNLSVWQIKLATTIKSLYPDVHVSCILADLPIHTRYNRIYTWMGLKQKSIDYIFANVRQIDSFIVLANKMREALNIIDKPYIIMEGMYKGSGIDYSVKKENENVILYTGALVNQYGVGDLLDAFLQIQDSSYRLWLCGDGDCVTRIKELQQIDHRINYFGTVSSDKARELQRKAKLLVNPRHSKEEFTAYSFPSKTMEYLASGTTTLMAPLECLPDEYKTRLELFDDETVSGMSKKIMEVCSTPIEELERKGKENSDFILKQKSAKYQVGSIISFLDSITN